MPGRKAIALFSDGLPQSAGGIVEMASRASVSIYTFDPRGLASFYMTAVDYVAASTIDLGAATQAEQAAREVAYRASQRSLEELARRTGGLFFHDNNELDQGLAAALDDMSSYYLIGYQPHREDFEAEHGRVRYHRIEVKVLRPGLKVRSRRGFLGIPESADSGPKSPEEEFQSALLSPFRGTGVPVQLSAFYSASPNRDAKTGRRRTVLRAHGTRTEKSRQAAVERSTPRSGRRISMQPLRRVCCNGFDIDVPRPGAYQLRIAVRDRNSDKLGSAHEFVRIPDFNRSALALSSIMLHDSAPERDEALVRSGVFGAGSAVTRAFAPGSTLNYDCGIFGKAIDKASSVPPLEMQVRIFRGSERIFSSAPMPVPAQKLPDLHASGRIKLPPTMSAGAYAVQVSVRDAAGKPIRTAEQWTDFTLVQTAPAHESAR